MPGAWLKIRRPATRPGHATRLCRTCAYDAHTHNRSVTNACADMVFNWLRVFRSPGASGIGQSRRQQRHRRMVWLEQCRGLRGTVWHKTQVIAGFLGSGSLAALPVHGAAFSLYFKKLAHFTKLATS